MKIKQHIITTIEWLDKHVPFLVVLSGVIMFTAAWAGSHKLPPAPRCPIPSTLPSEQSTREYVAALDVARVFGRSQGCTEAKPELITAIAVEAVRDNLDSRILAALVAVESACDPMAVSKRGAIGLTQVMPKIWKDRFDFSGPVNLLNPTDNLRAGAAILGDLINRYGVVQGVRRYQGTGVDCASCDDNYVPKILALAGKR